MAEVNIKTRQKNLGFLGKEYKIKEDKIKKAIDRAVGNAKRHQARLDELLEEKESLHVELKKAVHYGESQCEHCLKFFTAQGLSRHKASCSMKPDIKIVKKHEKEIKEDKADLEVRKAALQKELDELEKVAKILKE